MLDERWHQVFFNGDVSKPPKAGDKFIQLDSDEVDLTLDVRRGVYPEGSSGKPAPLRFSTTDKLQEAIQRAREDALGRGFKLYNPILAEGEPLPNPPTDE